MIVKKSSEGLHIIWQSTHGLLAGKIAEQLKIKLRPKLWLETLVAIVEHDDQQLDFDEKKLFVGCWYAPRLYRRHC
jgi:hypothetical protein